MTFRDALNKADGGVCMARVFYQSIGFYNHEVYKCQGAATQEILGNGRTHEEYYRELFEKYDNPIDSLHNPDKIHSHKVMVLDRYLGDRIKEDLSPFTEGSLIPGEIRRIKTILGSLSENDKARPGLEARLQDLRRIMWGEREDFEQWEA